MQPPSNEPDEGENCNGNVQATYSITGTYSHTVGWNIGKSLKTSSAADTYNPLIFFNALWGRHAIRRLHASPNPGQLNSSHGMMRRCPSWPEAPFMWVPDLTWPARCCRHAPVS